MFVGDIIFYFYVLLGVGGGFSHLTPARSMKGNPKFNDMRDFAISFSYHYYIIHLFNSLIWGPDTRGTVFSFYLQFTPPHHIYAPIRSRLRNIHVLILFLKRAHFLRITI